MSNGDRSRAPSCKSSACDGWCSNCIKYYRKRGGGQSGSRGGNRRSNRRFPPDNGTVNGRSAYIKQQGDRTEAYEGPEKVGKTVSNDGLNADYVRDDDGNVILDSDSPDPYNPRSWRRH